MGERKGEGSGGPERPGGPGGGAERPAAPVIGGEKRAGAPTGERPAAPTGERPAAPGGERPGVPGGGVERPPATVRAGSVRGQLAAREAGGRGEAAPAREAGGRGEATRDERRGDYRHFLKIATRWMDNDVYGHVNNVVYYAFFDTVINRYLIDRGVLDVERGDVIGLAVETQCRFFRPLAFPDVVDAGLRVARVGGSSVRYEVGLFAAGRDEIAAAGHFVHVFVDRASRRPIALPAALRAALEALLTG